MDRSLQHGKQNERFITVNGGIFINPRHRLSRLASRMLPLLLDRTINSTPPPTPWERESGSTG